MFNPFQATSFQTLVGQHPSDLGFGDSQEADSWLRENAGALSDATFIRHQQNHATSDGFTMDDVGQAAAAWDRQLRVNLFSLPNADALQDFESPVSMDPAASEDPRMANFPGRHVRRSVYTGGGVDLTGTISVPSVLPVMGQNGGNGEVPVMGASQHARR